MAELLNVSLIQIKCKLLLLKQSTFMEINVQINKEKNDFKYILGILINWIF